MYNYKLYYDLWVIDNTLILAAWDKANKKNHQVSV